ncbi:MAG TPA: amino acid carrier protein [Woeseiaceae bacterium]|nr:amino acid carrier protein [Woeseiaceae bacterium]
MTDDFLNFISGVSEILWGPWTMIFIAFVSVYLSVRARFFQITNIPYIIRHTIGELFNRRNENSHDHITPFQAAATSLAGTVGMGNMAGVATALSIGGPGAIFWMWIISLFGMITKTAEITLGVHYRDVDAQGQRHGGPMYYIEKALGWRLLTVLFSVGVVINAFFSSSLLQAHTVGRAFKAGFDISPYLVTGIMAIVAALVALGGIRRIGKFCEATVPIMALVYLSGAMIIVLANVETIPNAFLSIFNFAFAPAPAIGGFAGATIVASIQMGMARGMLSNEAGLGNAPMVHAKATTEHPFKQGLWGAVEVFFDTTVVCSATAIVILSSGVLENGASGIELLIDAFGTFYGPQVASLFISFAILSFCLSTQIASFVYFRTAIDKLLGGKVSRYLTWIYFLPGVLFAGVSNVDRLWALANISVAASALPNLLALLFLSGAFIALMKDYLTGECVFATHIVDIERRYVKMAKGKSFRTPT